MVATLAVLVLIAASSTQLYWTSSENLAKYVAKNEVVLVEFWATWCPSCRVDFDKTLAAARKYPKAKIVMIAISDNAYDINNFIKGKKIPKNVLIAIWRGSTPVTSVPRFRAYYKGRMILETDSLDKMRKVLE